MKVFTPPIQRGPLKVALSAKVGAMPSLTVTLASDILNAVEAAIVRNSSVTSAYASPSFWSCFTRHIEAT